MAEKITCSGPCGEAKDQTEFYGNSKKCKVCTLARQKELKASKAAGGGKAKARKKVARKKAKRAARKSAVATPAQETENHALFVPAGGLGLTATLEIDKDTGNTDIHLEQTTKDLGTQNVWLGQLEAQSLRRWLNEKLGGRE